MKERRRIQSDEWVKATATRVQEVDVEPFDYDLDISREVDTHNCLANYLCLKFMPVFFFFFFKGLILVENVQLCNTALIPESGMLYCHCGKGYHYCHANYFNICCVKKGNIRKRDSVGIASLTYGTIRLNSSLSIMQLSKPQKVPIPERYVESDSEEPLSPEEQEERFRRAERIKNLLAKSR